MNPKQSEWLAMDRVADWRREANADRVRLAATSAAPEGRAQLTRLAGRRAQLGAAARTALTAAHLLRPRGPAVS